jgi:hypothetical protein
MAAVFVPMVDVTPTWNAMSTSAATATAALGPLAACIRVALL